MKLTKQTNNRKSRLVSLTSVIALFMCAVLLWAFLIPVVPVRADDEVDIPPEKIENGIRFVQVAAGYDFAIGLTYDGKLYGWSIGDNPGRGNSATTLGEYYTATPTEINFQFRQGPGDLTPYATFNEERYHSIVTNDRIKSIAATAYTAAFVTEKGYLYTWGRDDDDYPYHDVSHTEVPSGQTHYLLLRPVTEQYTWQVPDIIDYFYYNTGNTYSGNTGREMTPTEQLMPVSNDSFTSLAAGEYNYIFMFERTEGQWRSDKWVGAPTGNMYHTFVWGSALYNTVNSRPQESFTYSGNVQVDQEGGRAIFCTFVTPSNTGLSVVAGGYTVGINDSSTSVALGATSLTLRGRNFITTADVTVAGDGNKTYTVVPTSKLKTVETSDLEEFDIKSVSVGIQITSTTDVVKEAIAGGGGHYANDYQVYGLNYGQYQDMYYARQALSQSSSAGVRYTIETYPADFLVGNDNGKIETYGDDQEALKPVRYPVALGNDIGYGISGGTLYGWGDDKYGQISRNGATGTNFDAPNVITTGSFVSVVAGKQKSASRPSSNQNNRAFYGAINGTLGESSDEGTTYPFLETVQNAPDYISAVLANDGVIHAWANGVATKQLRFMGDDYSGNKQEKFVAIYSAYGHNLFAVTERGKLVRITVNSSGDDFEQYVYDEFVDKNGAPITNWTVDNNNLVVFSPSAAPTVDKINPDFDTATFYIWTSTLDIVTIESDEEDEEEEDDTPAVAHTVLSNGSSVGYKPLISGNNIGDAYRIVGLTSSDANIAYLKADNLTQDEDGDKSADTYYAPKFFFDGNLMTEAQQQNMFEFDMVYDATNGVGIRIHPLQSSKGKNIRIDFYVARCNDYNKYSASYASSTGYTATDNAIYYDYERCQITFSIADTPSIKTFETHGGDGNSNIPLLDPNNPHNTYFSVAAQDVSKGVDELIKFLTGYSDAEQSPTLSNFTTFQNKIIEQMEENDDGFPAASRISDGDLEYYLTANDLAKYNNRYQHLFEDRDSDRVTLRKTGSSFDSPVINSGEGVEGDLDTIDVKVAVIGEELGYSLKSELSAENLLKTISTDFNNVYGLYNFGYVTESGVGYLTFSYDIVIFEATGSSGSIRYAGANSNATSMTGYQTTYSNRATAASASLYEYTINTYNFSAESGYVETTTTAARINESGLVYVYSQPTLRLKSDLNNSATDKNGNTQSNKNTYTEERGSALYVGDTITINLSSYVNYTDETEICFTFENKSDDESLDDFNKQFIDYTGQPGQSVVTLSQTSIIVHPTTEGPINFTVAVQRFVDANHERYFTYAPDSPTEKIFLTFNFTNIIGFNIQKNGEAQLEYLVTDTTVIELFGDGDDIANSEKPFIYLYDNKNNGLLSQTSGATNAYRTLRNNARIFGLYYSEESKSESAKLFTCVQGESDRTKFTITPLRSGTGKIQFLANVYGESVSFTLTINVSKEVTSENSITIIDDQYVTVSELDEILRSANSFNADATSGRYHILYGDVRDNSVKNNDKIYNAIYFTNEAGEMGFPPFIKNAVFENIESETETTIRIIASNSTVELSHTYYMHVRFTNAASTISSYDDVPDSSIIEVIVPVKSGKIRLQAETGGDLIATIDCRHTPKETDWWTTEGSGLETRVTIELLYLLNLDETQAPDRYKIFLVSADSSAAQYFQYDKGSGDRTIVITPKQNTNQSYELSVSVYNENDVKTTKVITFSVSISGIVDKLPVMSDDGLIGYGNIWLYSAAIVFGVLFIIFIIRFILYMKARSKQRAIIKRNQELIRMRDRMHGKATAASREQIVKSKLKMEDPKYAKMFSEMRRDKEEESGVALVNSDLAATADKKAKKKKKGGKKSVAELKAELEAKKAAFAAAQGGGVPPVTPFATDVPVTPVDGGFGMEGGGFVPPDAGFGAPVDGGFGAPVDGGFGAPVDGFGADAGYGAPMDENTIVFDASDIGDGNM